jgi:rhomboid protease GluP
MADEVLRNSKGLSRPGASSDAAKANPPLTPAGDSPSGEPEIGTASASLRDQRFNRAMAATQRPVVTPCVIAVNAAVFLLMALKGFSARSTGADRFLSWGADFGPLTTHGQWWRIVTAAFVHANFIHLLLNMIILWSVGMFAERLFGRVGFIALYLFAAIGANLASLAWQPFTVAMGASGAIFGLYGGLLAVLLLHQNTVPRPRIVAIGRSAAIFIGINLVYGLTQSNLDMAALIGGLASGFVLGCGLMGPLVPADPDWRQLRSLVVALAGTAVVVIFALRLPPVDDWKSDLSRLIPLDAASQRIYDNALRKVQQHQMSAAQFAQVIDRQILPPWNAELQNLLKLKLLKQQQELAGRVAEYMSLRAEAWALMVKGVSATDPAVVRQSLRKQAAAQATLQIINRELPAAKAAGK